MPPRLAAVACRRDNGVLVERRDRWRTRHGHQATPIPDAQQTVSRLLVELALAAELLGVDDDDGEIDRMHPTGSHTRS